MIPFFTKVIESAATKVPGSLKLFNPYYETIVSDEISIANIGADDHVLIIGGGPVPTTAMLIHEKTNAKVTVIDHDKNVVPKALKCIHKQCSNREIRVMHGCVKDFDLSIYSVIHVAKQVSPKACVLKHILKHAKKNTRILVRFKETEKTNQLYAVKQSHKNRLVKETCLFTV